MGIFLAINSGLRFCLEIGTIVLLIILGFSKTSFPVNFLVGGLLPLLFIGLWFFFVAPASPNRAGFLVRMGIELFIYLSTTVLLFNYFSMKTAIFYLVFALLNSGFNQLSDQCYQ